MIARVWRARATRDGLVEYRALFMGMVLPALERLPGFAGATVLYERDVDNAGGNDAEVVVVTRWQSMGDVRGFAGNDLTRAVVEPAAHACLTWADDRVSHYEIELARSS